MKKHQKLGKGSYCTLYFSGSADGLSVPDEAIAIIDRHVVVGEDWEKVRGGELYRLAERVGIRAELKIEKYRRPTPEMLPYAVKENNRFVRRFKETYREVRGKEVEITYGASVGGDFNYFGTYLANQRSSSGQSGGATGTPPTSGSVSHPSGGSRKST